jgi:hypothetical protein
MITDAATTPTRPLNQAIFGASTALAYGILLMLHIEPGVTPALRIVVMATDSGSSSAAASRSACLSHAAYVRVIGEVSTSPS